VTTQDDIARASARALIRVLSNYNLDREWGGPTPIWEDLKALGHCGTAADFQVIALRYAGTAAAAFCGGVKNRAPRAALYLALATFARVTPAFRFLDSSRWIALMFAFMGNKVVAEPTVQDEVLGRLEMAFKLEMRVQTVQSPSVIAELDSPNLISPDGWLVRSVTERQTMNRSALAGRERPEVLPTSK
jgi:hypothetical protein